MPFDITTIHTIVFYLLYAAAAAATFVIVERLIVFAVSLRDARQLQRALTALRTGTPIDQKLLDRPTAPAVLLKSMLDHGPNLADRGAVEDISEALYIEARAQLTRNIWVLDTLVTAAPLLGLLGTILGIIETFSALAQSGISDPAAVSRGIGTALYATALGISVALYGLVFFNHFQMRVDAISESLKTLLLRAGLTTGGAMAAEDHFAPRAPVLAE